MPVGSLPAATGKTMRFTGTTVLKVENSLITEEIGLDDGVSALTQSSASSGKPELPGNRACRDHISSAGRGTPRAARPERE